MPRDLPTNQGVGWCPPFSGSACVKKQLNTTHVTPNLMQWRRQIKMLMKFNLANVQLLVVLVPALREVINTKPVVFVIRRLL
jgi:hypothetical protein